MNPTNLVINISMNSQTSDNKFLVTHQYLNICCAKSQLNANTLDTSVFHSSPDDTKTKMYNHTPIIFTMRLFTRLSS